MLTLRLITLFEICSMPATPFSVPRHRLDDCQLLLVGTIFYPKNTCSPLLTIEGGTTPHKLFPGSMKSSVSFLNPFSHWSGMVPVIELPCTKARKAREAESQRKSLLCMALSRLPGKALRAPSRHPGWAAPSPAGHVIFLIFAA